MKNITLLIGSCDSYSFLWDNFVTLTDRYWDADCRKLFTTECKEANYPGYETHKPGNLEWSNRMLSALDTINTKYTFFVLDDYFFTENLDEKELNFHIDFMEEVNANKIMLDTFCRHLTLINPPITMLPDQPNRTIHKLSPNSNYLTSIQPSIWKTKYLKKVMHKNWNPWEFEIQGSKNLIGKEHNTYSALRDKRIYWNAIHQGREGKQLAPGWENIKQKENLSELNF